MTSEPRMEKLGTGTTEAESPLMPCRLADGPSTDDFGAVIFTCLFTVFMSKMNAACRNCGLGGGLPGRSGPAGAFVSLEHAARARVIAASVVARPPVALPRGRVHSCMEPPKG